MSTQRIQLCEKILKEIMVDPDSKEFLDEVDLERYADYLYVVQKQIWLKVLIVKTKVQNKNHKKVSHTYVRARTTSHHTSPHTRPSNYHAHNHSRSSHSLLSRQVQQFRTQNLLKESFEKRETHAGVTIVGQ